MAKVSDHQPDVNKELKQAIHVNSVDQKYLATSQLRRRVLSFAMSRGELVLSSYFGTSKK